MGGTATKKKEMKKKKAKNHLLPCSHGCSLSYLIQRLYVVAYNLRTAWKKRKKKKKTHSARI